MSWPLKVVLGTCITYLNFKWSGIGLKALRFFKEHDKGFQRTKTFAKKCKNLRLHFLNFKAKFIFLKTTFEMFNLEIF